MIKDILKFSYLGLRKKKLRSWLTILGIFIAIASIVALFSLGLGLQTAIDDQLRGVGADKIIIIPGGGFGPLSAGVAEAKLTDADVETVEKTRGVSEVGMFLINTMRVEFNDKTRFSIVQGIPVDERRHAVEDMELLEVINGRELARTDRNKALAGFNLANDESIFGKTVRLGDNILIEKTEFEIVGVIKKFGAPPRDAALFVPLETLRDLVNRPEEASNIVARVEKGEDPAIVAERIKKDLRKARGVEEGKEDFSLQTFEQTAEALSNVFFIVQAVVLAITAIALIIGGIGITTTMYTSVIERTKEIGVLKAVGARNSTIMTIFLFESGMLGLVGGIIGVILGVLIAEGVQYIGSEILGVFLLRAEFPAYLIIGTLLFAFIVGAVSGATPARQASKLNPVDALRKIK